MEAAAPLMPGTSDLFGSLRRFLAERLGSQDDLSRSPNLTVELSGECSDLEASLDDLDRRLSESIAAYASHAEEVGGHLGEVRAGLIDLRSSIAGPSFGGEEETRVERKEQILVEELAALAKEVARVETVRAYAETTLKLDSLIDDVEDEVSSSVTGKLRSSHVVNSEEIHMMAINSLKQIEDILMSVTKTRSQWARLVSAVDYRVDRALAVLRPQAIGDHRSLLASLGWPPPLGSSNLANLETGKSAEFLNPLISMKGELKGKYGESFLSLCNLQELQRRRKSRQLEGHNLEIALHQPLWVIEELANPISVASERHFSKWVEKPEFIFALVYKIMRDFVDSMDEVLQPLADKARLVGYSCREEWISAMMTSVSTYLSKEVFPKYVDLLQEGTWGDVPSQARISWLNLVDLMISFDKRTQSLITNLGLLLSLREDENLQRVSVLSVFCDRPDWLEIWAEIELREMLDKLKSVMLDEKSWKTRIQGTVLMSGLEDYRSPTVSGAVLQAVSLLIDRSRPLPSVALRARFVRLAGAPLVQELLDCLLRRCQEAEGLTALADDDAILKVCQSINAARYAECILTEWCEDAFFLEMEIVSHEDTTGRGCIFEKEVSGLKKFKAEWVEKISMVILRGFDTCCRDYFKNKKQWQEKTEGLVVSRAFVGALDYLQGKISRLEKGLNAMDFVAVWRSVAGGVDQLIFNGVFISNAKFHNGGVERLGVDLEVLFQVFMAWCLKPGGFFPRLCGGLRLLKMERQLKDEKSKVKEGWLKENDIRYLTVTEAEKIMKNRVFGE
ncbi:RINT1-like protein MAG2 [Cocos nucifera]|uniref:RINT1-like protein MAG2 n=1 Tax=Cocos nucifera TaxID=13894 RepID=A0A8K0N267_COCNU|nr:RINT1-like protein MAG2 [Cocos nucifera]